MNGPLLVSRMVLSVAAVAALALWDEARESNTGLADFAQEQTTLAGVAAAGLAAQLDGVRRDALAAADESAAGHRPPPSVVNSYVALRVRSLGGSPLPAPDDWQALPLSVPTPDGRFVDALVPTARLVPGETWFARAGALALVRSPHARQLHAIDGRAARAETILRAIDAGRPSVQLSRAEAAALGLPERLAVAGIAAVNAGPLGRWTMVVVASAARERDREARARWRLVLGVLVAGSLVVSFGGAALRTQRKGFELRQQLAFADRQREREAQLERENRAATMVTLAAGVAHEVSSPLGVIAGRAEQLVGRVTDDRGQRAVQVILEQAGRIREVIRGFLRLARGDVPTLDPVEPSAVAHGAVTLVEHRFTKEGVSLALDVPEALPAVPGDLRLLEHALVNLLLNACDACDPGGRVTLRARAEGAVVIFEVEDDGAGISAADAARVVEPFFSTKPADQGSGLGLAIANEIVKIHRGALALTPRSPRGTRAEVRLPTTPGGDRAGA